MHVVSGSSLSLLYPPNSVGGDIVMRPFVGGWASEWVCPSPLALWAWYRLQFFPDHFQTSHLHCWWMTRGGTLLILGHGVKGQGQLWHFVCKTLWARYRLQFLPNHFQTSHASYWWWEEEPYWFWVAGSKVKVNFNTLLYKTLWAQ